MTWHVWKSQRTTCESQYLPSVVLVSRVELQSLDSVASIFTCWITSLILHLLFKLTFHPRCVFKVAILRSFFTFFFLFFSCHIAQASLNLKILLPQLPSSGSICMCPMASTYDHSAGWIICDLKHILWGWKCVSVTENFPSMHEVMGSILSINNNTYLPLNKMV